MTRQQSNSSSQVARFGVRGHPSSLAKDPKNGQQIDTSQRSTMMNKVAADSSRPSGDFSQQLKLRFKPISSGEFVNMASRKREYTRAEQPPYER